METSNLRVFRFAELKTATRNFRPDEMVGVGSFGNVFRGWLDEKTLAPSKAGTGIMVAIKRYSDSMQGVEECGLEVKFLGRLFHPNLVKLLGYCFEKKKMLLVYEFGQRGSLDNNLFSRIPDKEPSSWDNRLKIAIGAARGLTFLHSLQIIHMGVTPSNILLDGVLLEILTGLEASDLSRSEEEISLVYWAKPLLSDETKLQTIMDEQIKGQYFSQEALQTAHITLKCLETDPKTRPSMKEVVEELEHIQAMKEKPNLSELTNTQSPSSSQ